VVRKENVRLLKVNEFYTYGDSSKGHLAGCVSTNICAGIVESIYYKFVFNRINNAKRQFSGCATTAFNELFVGFQSIYLFFTFSLSPAFSALPNSYNTLTKVAHSDRLFVRM